MRTIRGNSEVHMDREKNLCQDRQKVKSGLVKSGRYGKQALIKSGQLVRITEKAVQIRFKKSAVSLGQACTARIIQRKMRKRKTLKEKKNSIAFPFRYVKMVKRKRMALNIIQRGYEGIRTEQTDKWALLCRTRPFFQRKTENDGGKEDAKTVYFYHMNHLSVE